MQSLMVTHLKKFTSLTRFEQTLFGLPFILTGASLPFFDSNFVNNFYESSWSKQTHMLFILPAFVAARIAGMSFNQFLDRDIDALNPRTSNRPLPKGLVSPKQALKVACISLSLFLLFTFCINALCFKISCFSASLLVLYSYMKRIHYSCHLVLGMIHFLGPLTAFVAIKQTINLPIVLLSSVAFFLHVGNDIIYAFQDYAFDCKQKLHSVPSHFGIAKSFKIALVFQALCVLSLILFGMVSGFFWIYYMAPAIATLAFYFFHKKWETSPRFFFVANVSVSIATVIFTIIAGAWRT